MLSLPFKLSDLNPLKPMDYNDNDLNMMPQLSDNDLRNPGQDHPHAPNDDQGRNNDEGQNDDQARRGGKRRLSAVSSVITSPPLGPVRSSHQVRPPRKKVIMATSDMLNAPSTSTTMSASGLASGSSEGKTLKSRIAVPANAPIPWGGRGRGSHLSRLSSKLHGVGNRRT